MRMIGGEGPTLSRLYRIPGVNWLLAEQAQFNSTTTLQHADLNGFPQDSLRLLHEHPVHEVKAYRNSALFNAQLETASLRKMKDWRTLLLQYLLQQNRSVTGEDKGATDAGECKQYCGMPLLTDLAVMMRIDPLALIHGLREFVTVVYGPVMSFVFPDVQVKAYRNSVLYVNLVSVVDCSVLNWVEQRELRELASDDRLFGRIAEQGWVLMDFNNNFKCRMGREDLSHIQFNPKLWNLRPVVKDSGAAMRVPLLPEAYAHVKENQ